VPVAAVGETVAVSVMLVPVVVEVLDAARLVVVDVVPLELLLEPQPVLSIAARVSNPRVTERSRETCFT
jgi:hypothetical protein